MELDPVHLRADDLGDAVVRSRKGVEGAEGEAFLVFVDLLRDERDVEEELEGDEWVRTMPELDVKRERTSSFSPTKKSPRRQYGEGISAQIMTHGKEPSSSRYWTGLPELGLKGTSRELEAR